MAKLILPSSVGDPTLDDYLLQSQISNNELDDRVAKLEEDQDTSGGALDTDVVTGTFTLSYQDHRSQASASFSSISNQDIRYSRIGTLVNVSGKFSVGSNSEVHNSDWISYNGVPSGIRPQSAYLLTGNWFVYNSLSNRRWFGGPCGIGTNNSRLLFIVNFRNAASGFPSFNIAGGSYVGFSFSYSTIL